MAKATSPLGESDAASLFTEVAESWFLVTDQGGGETNGYDLSVIPTGYERAVGPLRPTKSSRTNSSPEATPNTQARTARLTEPQRYVGYWNVDEQAYVPFSAGYVAWYVRHSATGEEWGLGATGIGADGGFPAYCPYNFDYETYWILYWGGIDVYISGAPYYGGYENAYSCQVDDPTMFILPGNVAHVLTNMNQIVVNSRAYFQHSRGPLQVNVSSTNGTSNYSWWSDVATIFGNDVWDSPGRFTQAHEYGHALDHKSLGAPKSIFGYCPSPHYIQSSSGLKCALSEGFASYDSYAVWGTSIWQTLAWGEANPFLPPGAPGDTWEAAVGSLLYDLSDEPNEPWDQVSFTGQFVASLLKNCRVGPYVTRSNGVDHFVHCLEQSVVPQSLGYFTARVATDPWPTWVLPNTAAPSGWSQSALRTLWLKDLYLQ